MSTTRSTKAKTRFLDVDGRELSLASSVSKTHRDILFEYLARPDVEPEEPPVDAQGKKAKKKTIDVVVDFSDPLSGKPLTPGPNAILCQKCGLNKFGCKNPYLEPIGAEDPLITVVFESVSKVEDEKGVICSGGTSGHLASLFSKICQKLDFPYNRIRWLPLVRCSKKIDDGKTLNYKTKAQWCGHYALDDIRRHPPKIIMPIGTTALGYFSYKSNAQDWGGKLLTFRGWPDDWLMDPKFSRPSPYPVDPEKYPEAAGWTVEWHPFFGKPPTSFDRIPLMPVQHPKIILAAANRTVSQRWFNEIAAVIQSAKDGITPRQYDRPWYKISEDPDEIIANLQWLIDHRRTLVTYDTETTGLYPFSEGAAIVYMMFRWDDDQGEPQSIGFPWDYDGSPIRPYIDELSPVVVAALQASRLIGHNLTFDALFTYANVKGVDLDKLADACGFDTWHEAFVLQQQRGTLGLDMMAYRFVPDLAGYDEDYSILIELYRELLHPDEGGHYANCPAEYRETHFKHYVMGDVEVAHQTHHVLQEKLAESPTYKIPLAHPTLRGKFRLYSPPSRHFVYNRIVSPASQVLIKMMGRGMHINLDELTFQEETFPQLIFEARRKMREVTPEVLAWCETMEATEPGWFFDLESKEQLRHVLFTLMGLPVKNLTESGRKKYESVSDAERFESREDFLKMAAIDKFTLNILAAENPKVRPLLEYRSIYKQYSSYVRPMRNIHSAGIDKRERSKHQHLMRDGRVHAKFIIPGTRSGRLACLPITEYLATDRGLVQLGEIRPGDVIQAPGNPTPIKAVFNRQWQPIVELTLQGGIVIRSSPGHHHIGSDGLKIEARLLRVGDELRPCTTPGPGVRDLVNLDPWPVKYVRGRKKVLIPTLLDEDLAFVWGHLSAEGGIYRVPVRQSTRSRKQTQKRAYRRLEPTGKYVPNRVMTCFGWDEVDLQKYIGKLFYGIFGRKPRMFKSTTALALDLCSRDLGEWLVYHGLGGLAREKQIPPAIFRSPQKVQWAYLRGLFEGDGSCHGSVKLTTYSRRMADGVQLLLSSLGVLCRIKRGVGRKPSGKRRQRFSVVVCPESYDRVRSNRIFWSDKKQSGIPKPGKSRKSYWAIKSIRVCKPEEVIDIEVDNSSNTFVYKGIVTHNSQDPNLQQLGSRGMVKRLYGSRFGREGGIYQGDLSQIELRLIAAACGDESMVRAYCDNIDLHSLTMSKIFNLPYEQCTKEYAGMVQKAGKDAEAKDLDRKRKLAKCVDPSTLTSVNGRIVRVGDLHSGREEDTFYPLTGMIAGPQGPVPLKHFYSNGIKERLLICSKRGIIACSEEHPLLMSDGTLKKAKYIQKWDVLAEPKRMVCGNDDSVIPFNPIHLDAEPSGQFRIHVDEDLAYLLGLYYGDGECGTSIGICFGGKPEFFKWQDIVVESIKKCGFETNLIRTTWDSDVDGVKIVQSGPSKGTVCCGSSGHVTFGSTRAQDIFIQLGAIVLTDETDVGRQRSLKIPSWLFNAKTKIKVSFLAGWFDTDGSALRQGSLCGCTKSWIFAQDICVLLNSMGIDFSITPGLNKTYNKFYYRITLSVKDTWAFFKDVLRHPDKKSLLRPPRQGRVARKNLCTEVIQLTPGHVVDVEVNTPEHLFVANGLIQKNTANFLTGYGGGAQGFQGTLAEDGIYYDLDTCERFLTAFFEAYPSLRKYLSFYKHFIQENAVAVSILGRVRAFEEVYSDDKGLVNKALRAGCNHLIQATASDMMLICNSVIEGLMREAELQSVITSTVHDSLVIDFYRPEIQTVHDIVMDVFTNIPDVLEAWLGQDIDLSWSRVLPFDGDAEVGANYGDLHKIERNGNDWDAIFAKMDEKE